MDQVLPSGGKIVERDASTSSERSSQVSSPTDGGFPRPQRLDHENERTSTGQDGAAAAAGSDADLGSNGSSTSGRKKVSLFQQRRMQSNKKAEDRSLNRVQTSSMQASPSHNQQDVHGSSESAGVADSGATRSAPECASGSLYYRMQRNSRLAKELNPEKIHQENASQLQQMTHEEQQELLADVFSRFSPEMLQSWSRGLGPSSAPRGPNNQSDVSSSESRGSAMCPNVDVHSSNNCAETSAQHATRAPPAPSSTNSVAINEAGSSIETDPTTSYTVQQALTADGDIDMSKLPKEELDKLQCTLSPEGTNSTTDSDEPRFHLDGHLIIAGTQSNETELYHHGDDPTTPGYTMNELVYLAGSTMPNQRALALKTLANIMWNRRQAIRDGLFNVKRCSSKSAILRQLPQGVGPLILSSLLDLKEISDSSLKKIAPGMVAVPQYPTVSRAAISALASFVCCIRDHGSRFGDTSSSVDSSSYTYTDTFMGHSLPPCLLSPQALQASCVSDLQVTSEEEVDKGITLSSFSSLFVDDPVLALGKLPYNAFQALLNRLTVSLSFYLQAEDASKGEHLDNSADSMLKIITSLCLRKSVIAQRVVQHRLPQKIQQNVRLKPDGLITAIQQLFDSHLTSVCSQGKRPTSVQRQILSSCMDVFLALISCDRTVAEDLVINTASLSSVRSIFGMIGLCVGLDSDESPELIRLFEKAVRLCRFANLHDPDISSWLSWIQFTQSQGLFTLNTQKRFRCAMQFQFCLLAESMCHRVLSKLQDVNTPPNENAELLADLSNVLLPIQNFAFMCIKRIIEIKRERGFKTIDVLLLAGCFRLIVALSEVLISNNVSVAVSTHEEGEISCDPCLWEEQDPMMYSIEHESSVTKFQSSVFWCVKSIWESGIIHDFLGTAPDLDPWSLELLIMWAKSLNALGPNGTWRLILSFSPRGNAGEPGVLSTLKEFLGIACTQLNAIVSRRYGSNEQLDFGEALHFSPMQLCYFDNRRLWLLLAYTVSRMFMGVLASDSLSQVPEDLWNDTTSAALTATSACIPSEEAIASSLFKDILLSPTSLKLLLDIHIRQLGDPKGECDNVTRVLWNTVVSNEEIDTCPKVSSDDIKKWKHNLETAFLRQLGTEDEINNSVCIFRCDFLEDFLHLQATWPSQRWNKKSFHQQLSSSSEQVAAGCLRPLCGYSNVDSAFDPECAGLPLSLEPSWIFWPLRFVTQEFRNNVPSEMDIMDDNAAFSLTEHLMSYMVFVLGSAFCVKRPTKALERSFCKGILETSMGIGLIPLRGYGSKLNAAMRLLFITSERLHDDLLGGDSGTLGQLLQPHESQVETDQLSTYPTFSEALSLANDLITHWNKGICTESHTELAITWLFRLDFPPDVRSTASGSLIGDIRGMRFGQSLADMQPGSLGSPFSHWFRLRSEGLRSFELFEEAYKTLRGWASSMEFDSLRADTDPRDIVLYCIFLLITVEGIFSAKSILSGWTKANAVEALINVRSNTLLRDVLQCTADEEKTENIAFGIHAGVSFDKKLVDERYKVIEKLCIKYHSDYSVPFQHLKEVVSELL